MKRKTSELEGVLLDMAVAICEGWKFSRVQKPCKPEQLFYACDQPGRETLGSVVLLNDVWWGVPRFSGDWAAGGPIIDRERICLYPADGAVHFIGVPMDRPHWLARKLGQSVNEIGSAPLIAAMRAYVASKLGEEVDLP